MAPMFGELEREVQRLSGPQQIRLDFSIDQDGYLDRQCPECQRDFKVAFEDWSLKIRDAAFCPFCGHGCEADGWHTPAQVDYIRSTVMNSLRKRVGNALNRDAARFNREQAFGGLVEASMRFEPGREVTVTVPRPAEGSRSKFVCGSCSCRYAADSTVRFCPACRQSAR